MGTSLCSCTFNKQKHILKIKAGLYSADMAAASIKEGKAGLFFVALLLTTNSVKYTILVDLSPLGITHTHATYTHDISIIHMCMVKVVIVHY